VGNRGLVTIPAEIRRELGIKKGDILTAEAVNQTIVFKLVP